ncbi:hypothetical protein HK105_204821 [Polyrhizophydium stewartii]|uniref:Single-stranded DNA-binding protein n=1 Tax=Polyrhizophydium stewartii TaxID=2732419 RepID=A0ABR4N7Y7_9FUNG
MTSQRSLAAAVFNRVTLVGNIGREPHFRPWVASAATASDPTAETAAAATPASGAAPAAGGSWRFAVATRHSRLTNGQWSNETDWHIVRTNTDASRLGMGQKVLVEGELRPWHLDGKHGYYVQASRILQLGPKRDTITLAPIAEELDTATPAAPDTHKQPEAIARA